MLAVALTMAALVLASQQDICGAQLSIHTDSNTNSFSLKAPGLQQTFTRYYGAARPQQQEAEQPQQEQALVQQQQQQQLQQQQLQQQQLQQQQLQQQQQQQEQLYNQYRLTRLRGSGKPRPDQFSPAAQQQNQLSLQQQLQQQALLAQSGFGSAGATGAGSGVTSYADQMQAAFLDYQRQRLEFEQQQQQLQQQQQQLQQQQQQQLLQKLYRYYPDVQSQAQQQQQQQPAEGLQGANGFVYQRPQFLQAGGSAGSGLQRPVGASDFYATQQQQQDVLREQQQQLVAQQFATSQVAPTTKTSSAPSAASFQPSSDVSHVSFSSGNLKYSF